MAPKESGSKSLPTPTKRTTPYSKPTAPEPTKGFSYYQARMKAKSSEPEFVIENVKSFIEMLNVFGETTKAMVKGTIVDITFKVTDGGYDLAELYICPFVDLTVPAQEMDNLCQEFKKKLHDTDKTTMREVRSELFVATIWSCNVDSLNVHIGQPIKLFPIKKAGTFNGGCKFEVSASNIWSLLPESGE